MDDFSYVRPPAALARILKRTADLRFVMASEDRTGALLRTLAASKPGGRFLELGTCPGISPAWEMDGMVANSNFTTGDYEAPFQDHDSHIHEPPHVSHLPSEP